MDNNALTIKVFDGNKDGWMRWDYPEKNFPSDVDVSVSATVDDSESSGLWEYGLGVRYYTANEKYFYYMLSITSDAQWYFLSHDAKGFNTLQQGKIKDFDPTKSNKLNVIATGNKFEFFLNNKKLGEAEDDSIKKQKSYYVILSGTADDKDSSVSVSFKNLLVLKP
jgi:hypothetical protein